MILIAERWFQMNTIAKMMIRLLMKLQEEEESGRLVRSCLVTLSCLMALSWLVGSSSTGWQWMTLTLTNLRGDQMISMRRTSIPYVHFMESTKRWLRCPSSSSPGDATVACLFLQSPGLCTPASSQGRRSKPGSKTEGWKGFQPPVLGGLKQLDYSVQEPPCIQGPAWNRWGELAALFVIIIHHLHQNNCRLVKLYNQYKVNIQSLCCSSPLNIL